jgi:hypothetical protein
MSIVSKLMALLHAPPARPDEGPNVADIIPMPEETPPASGNRSATGLRRAGGASAIASASAARRRGIHSGSERRPDATPATGCRNVTAVTFAVQKPPSRRGDRQVARAADDPD